MNTEEKIIKETISLIDHQGYQSLSLRKLTNSLGLTTGAFFKQGSFVSTNCSTIISRFCRLSNIQQ
ncbi:hypothetical protein [Lactobacillus helveticus]|uniref:hypothetical protein n=1 Tax=Lactobacillus helveticus TaxID=1587 RepID=UPI001562A352|nr:hypothetical protein [Lactobacillus helveticus]NRO11202.1 hypothetical protein [Lactobacillus helveticus]